ncbi:DUF3426 domain-containing protein [Amphritea balenae]|uniref:DUF3426 domain-containing protein n=1 Tax=Amphritea balenae TaxID=452629 RepID=A0A3P1SMI3_9GAMM|nr:DUF3426 domain-containing protein [Amphritea balenae]RRC98356.1 DUF3426 domain-containing protein [Amphritea balenae]GGK81233.1 hypothetical protein GCM10007941_34570 [Amphritea balenae]
MSRYIITECPACTTRFQVTKGQLKIANGKVRCGSCLEVFNAEVYRCDDIPDTVELLQETAKQTESIKEATTEAPTRGAAIKNTSALSKQPHESLFNELKLPDFEAPTKSFSDIDTEYTEHAIEELMSGHYDVESDTFDPESDNSIPVDAMPVDAEPGNSEPGNSEPGNSDLCVPEPSDADLEQPVQKLIGEIKNTVSPEALPSQTGKPDREIPANQATSPDIDTDTASTVDESLSTSSGYESEMSSGHELINNPEPDSSLEPNNNPEHKSSPEPDSNLESNSSLGLTSSPEPNSSLESNSSLELTSSPEPDSSLESNNSPEPTNSPELKSSLELTSSPELANDSELNNPELHQNTGSTSPKASVRPFKTEPVMIKTIREKQQRPIGWSLASLALIILLAGQYLWFNRQNLSVITELTPAYQSICNQLPCNLEVPIVLSAISTRQLIVRNHKEYQGALTVDLLLENHAGFIQPYPAVQLSFSDRKGQQISQRTFQPKDFLNTKVAEPMQMPTAIPVQISFNILDPGQRAVSYEAILKKPDPVKDQRNYTRQSDSQ